MVREVPERIQRLTELAYNLWWSWHPEARDLFRMLDYSLWNRVHYNPVSDYRNLFRASNPMKRRLKPSR